MKTIVFILLSLFFVLAEAEDTPKTVTIGLTAGGNPEAIRQQSVLFAEKLQKLLNTHVNIFISKNYEGLADAVKEKKVDYAFLSALTYVSVENRTDLKVLLKKTWTGPYYYSTLVVRKDGTVKNLKSLKNKKIAFVDMNSTSGYLYPQVYLKKNKIADTDFKQIIFSGSHSASVAQLEAGEVDVAAVFTDDEKGLSGAWDRFGKDKKIKYKTLWVSEPIPNDPFVVRAEFYDKYPKFTHELMYVLIELQTDEANRKQTSEVMGTGELMPATSRQYDPVREMAKTLNMKL